MSRILTSGVEERAAVVDRHGHSRVLYAAKLATLRVSDEEEHQPGDRAPATAQYEELNVFGTPTGAVVQSVKATAFLLHRAASRGGRYARLAD